MVISAEAPISGSGWSGMELGVDHGSLGDAARGVDVLRSRADTLRRALSDATEPLHALHPWGLLGQIYLHGACVSLIDECDAHLKNLEEAFDGAHERITASSRNYSGAERVLVEMLGATRIDREEEVLRKLNPASRLYRDHRTVYGLIEGAPFPLNSWGASILHTIRFIGDLRSDDKYNITTDLAMLATDLSGAAFQAGRALQWYRTDPLALAIFAGVSFVTRAFYWTKDTADWFTGDPVRIGQAAYNFDSLSKGCHGLAEDFMEGIRRTLARGSWEGAAAREAMERLTALGEGIEETGHSADQVSAMLQLSSSVMGTFEGIVKGVISDAITVAVYYCVAYQCLMGPTAGFARANAVMAVNRTSATAATRTGRLLALAMTFLQRLQLLMRRAVARLRDINQRAFTTLRQTGAGRAFTGNEEFLGARWAATIVRKDNGAGDYSRLSLSMMVRSWAIQVRKAGPTNALREFGMGRSYHAKDGSILPDGKPRIGVPRYPKPNKDGSQGWVYNPVPIVSTSLQTLLPYGRALQYYLRAGDAQQDIDSKINIWEK